MNEKNLGQYLKLLEKNGLLKEHNLSEELLGTSVKYISYNSMDVKPGTLFIRKGATFKREYLKDAAAKGALCYITDEVIADDLPAILVTDIRKAISDVSDYFYDDIWNEKLRMIGVTGTKGKSTTTLFVKSIMDAYARKLGNKPIGLVTGIYTFDGERTGEVSDKLTTPEALELHDILAKCAENDCKYLVMESSSQGFKYHRTKALHYTTGCFLNLSEDHLSDKEHPDMEDYFQAKLMIVEQSDNICVNLEMESPYKERIIEAAEQRGLRITTFGRREKADIYGYDIKTDLYSVEFTVRYNGKDERLKANVGGFFNVDNALAAIAVASTFNVPIECIREGLAAVKIPARMEVYSLPNKDVQVIIDQAHNEVSFKALFDSLNLACPERKRLLVMGCSGGKAYTRRKISGEIADKEADRVILTEDDYGTEPFENICNDVMKYISKDKDVEMIINREEALTRALDTSEDGWLVITVGFGSGNQLKRGDHYEPAKCDPVVVKEYIEAHTA